MDSRAQTRESLVSIITDMGYPRTFGEMIADDLSSEKLMSRMERYLIMAKPRSAEEIADEMLSICSDRDRWIKKKEAEFYNAKYNELLNQGLENE